MHGVPTNHPYFTPLPRHPRSQCTHGNVIGIMRPGATVLTCSPGESLQSIIPRLDKVTGLPVISPEGRCIGVISRKVHVVVAREGDIAMQAMQAMRAMHAMHGACGPRPERHLNPTTTHLQDIIKIRKGRVEGSMADTVAVHMTSPAIVIEQNSTVRNAADLMLASNIRRLPVVDDQGLPVG